MNPERFSAAKTGELIPIQTPSGPDHAFIPDQLPPKWSFPIGLYQKLIDARAALAKLDGIGRTLPDPELLLTPLKRREAITSSRIEGTYATAEELMLFELSEVDPKSSHDPANSWREVSNYSRALSSGITALQNLPFCSRVMKDLHGILLSGVRGQHCICGDYRTHQVAIGSDLRYVPPPPAQMIDAMSSFEFYVNEATSGYDPLVRAYIAHYQFEAIHPFGDGNGRIGRVLLSLMISKWCNLSLPWLYMSAYFERYKDEYIRNLFAVSTDGAWEKWIEFCLIGTIQQANDAISRCEKLRLLKADMLKRMRDSGSASVRTERIIESLFRMPIVRVANLQRELEITYPTAQADLEKLVEAKIVEPLNNDRPRTYYASEIIGIAYRDIE